MANPSHPIALQVQALGKAYRIEPVGYRTLREDLMALIRRPFRLRSAARRETIWALRDVSFQVQRGEIVGLIGRNGAGKSTLLKLLARITRPTTGSADIYGRLGSLLEVGTGFHFELTGRENVFLSGAVLGMRRAEIRQRFDDIVAFAEIESFMDTPVKRYSSGMAMRLAFAVAAHLNTDILLVDEVLAVGDSTFQRKCLGKMSAVADEGRTVLFVSHNMGAIADLCTRCLHLSAGRIVGDGDPPAIIQQYLSEHVGQGYLDLQHWTLDRQGAGPMRILSLEILDDTGQQRAHFAYGETIRFRFKVQGRPGDRCTIGVSVRDPYGHVILHLTDADDAAELTLPDAMAVITVTLRRNILNDSTYYVTIWLGDSMNHLHDRVGNCMEFTVDSAFQGSIRSQGAVRLPAEWEIAAGNPP